MSKNKNNDNKKNGFDEANDKVKLQNHKITKRINTLDEGVIAFGEWLASKEDKDISCGPLILLNFQDNTQFLIFDRDLGRNVEVEIVDGVPQCKTCSESDCMHVGFTICASQRYRRNGMVNLT